MKRLRYFAVIELALLAYAAAYIVRMSFVIDGVRYFTLADDQMISMRYAENLANGLGLVWNAGGPRVEGYTNLLWMLYMAIFHALGVPRHLISVCIELTGVACLLLNLVFVRSLALRISNGSHAAALAAVLLTAFYVPLDHWAFQGTEVGILALMVTACTWLALRSVGRHEAPVGLYVLLGTTTLVRPDMLIFAVALVAGTYALDRSRRNVAIAAAILAAFAAAQTAFRLWYFGYPLPNTYYLKMDGFPFVRRIAHGLDMAFLFFAESAMFTIILVRGRRRLRETPGTGLLLSIVGLQVLYSIYVGGDAWEWWGGSNRFIAIAMPLFFVCVAVAAASFKPLSARESAAAGAFTTASPRFIAGVLIVAFIGNLMALAPYRPLERLLMIERPLQSNEDEQHVRAAIALRDASAGDAVVALTWAGAIAYFSERTCIDLLGKSDERIAHGPMHISPQFADRVIPGHSKWDYGYSIGQLQPDVIQAPMYYLTYKLDTPDAYLTNYELRRIGDSGWYVRRESRRVGGVPIANDALTPTGAIAAGR